ncbi:MAG: phosphoglycerate kinase [Candidatus Eremiobacteraeota bacterium]|nr:phosphoglycerate kinase [Candidatus Eremiobacteraeota bacterium]MCL5054750.1 phosphoglycerate kinase [Bacillota bacterium]
MLNHTLREADLKNKKVLVRVDYNVPLDPDGKIKDDTRIKETLPTLNYILEKGGSLILMSHLGRPKGKPDLKYSLRPAALHLEKLLNGKKVFFSEECVGEKTKTLSKQLNQGEVLLLENVRFHPGEERNDSSYAQELASLGDLFVNDAFGSAHRAHASTVGITQFLPSFAGFLLEKEVQVLSRLLENPAHPYFLILGGAKVSDKIGVLKQLIERIDQVIIGGGMAFTFLKAINYKIGASLVEEEQLLTVNQMLNLYPDKIKLPVDCVAAPSLKSPEQNRVIPLSKESSDIDSLQGLDIGPKTIDFFINLIRSQKPATVFWNGPMGVFELPEFSRGTFEVGKALAERAEQGGEVVVGGGDSISALKQLGLANKMTHLSTGGGASLEFLEGKSLPGITCLSGYKNVSSEHADPSYYST